MDILVLMHADVEHPGVFRRFLQEDGHRWDGIALQSGQSIPDISDYQALWVMGGPMDVWQEDEFPWLQEEKQFIYKAVVEKGVPFLGLCLGHQLLAEALGGKVGKSRKPEIGVMDVQLTEAGATGIFFDDFPDKFHSLQWHSAEIEKMPAGAACLATSPDCAVQAMRWGNRAYSVQFHLEVEAETVLDWAGIPAYAEALEKALGAGAVARLEKDVASSLPEFNKLAERLYLNWLQTAACA